MASVVAPLITRPNESRGSGVARSRERNLQGLIGVERELHDCRSIPELFTRASEIACGWCGFSRALVVSVEDQMLTAGPSGALSDPASDAMRRRLLAEPIPLASGSVESEFIRRGGSCGRSYGRPDQSLLKDALGLEGFALGAIMPENEMLALLLADSRIAPVDQEALDAVQVLAHLIARSLEQLFLRQRMNEFSAELRHLTTSAEALVKEALESPVTLPCDNGAGLVFAMAYTSAPSSADLWQIFTRRELDIAAKMVAGLSNREIGTALQISPETVKKYVARVMRKLGASNRADAAVKYMRLADASHGPSAIATT
jgi:DNA-binding CsgD family transcriptional regulator